VHAAEQQRPDVKEQRDQWVGKLTDACGGDFSRVLFLDETGAMTNLVRTHGRSDEGGVASPSHRTVTGRY
jgi:hypothetical protein